MNDDAVAYFAKRLRFETDCDDVADALAGGAPEFVLLDVRSRVAFDAGHVPGALNFERPLAEKDIAAFGPRPIVVYCWGPGCNGAVKAALQLAEMGRSVKEMLGGFEYWVREGHPVEGADAGAIAEGVDRFGLVKLRNAISCLCT
jgi:rhodanese-related sulfurtransferase